MDTLVQRLRSKGCTEIELEAADVIQEQTAALRELLEAVERCDFADETDVEHREEVRMARAALVKVTP